VTSRALSAFVEILRTYAHMSIFHGPNRDALAQVDRKDTHSPNLSVSIDSKSHERIARLARHPVFHLVFVVFHWLNGKSALGGMSIIPSADKSLHRSLLTRVANASRHGSIYPKL